MNFAQMLMMDVKPLPDTRASKSKKNDAWRDPSHMHRARHRVGVEKYKGVIGNEWSKTVDVAERLGMARMSIFKQLVKYAELGIIERRPVGGDPYNHRFGWEWRVK